MEPAPEGPGWGDTIWYVREPVGAHESSQHEVAALIYRCAEERMRDYQRPFAKTRPEVIEEQRGRLNALAWPGGV